MENWSNLVCGVSKLPIKVGEEVVCVPLVSSAVYVKKDLSGGVPDEGTVINTTDVLRLIAFPVKGIAGDDGLSKVHTDTNTRQISDHFGVSIEEFVRILFDVSSVENKKIDRLLQKSSALILKRSVFDELVKYPAAQFFEKDIAKEFDKLLVEVDEFDEKIREFSKTATEEEIKMKELRRSPFSIFGDTQSEVWGRFENIGFGIKSVYAISRAEFSKEIREHVIEGYHLIENLEAIGYFLYGTLRGGNDLDLLTKLEDIVSSELERKYAEYKAYEDDDYEEPEDPVFPELTKCEDIF